jgi:hypothetical protein
MGILKGIGKALGGAAKGALGGFAGSATGGMAGALRGASGGAGGGNLVERGMAAFSKKGQRPRSGIYKDTQGREVARSLTDGGETSVPPVALPEKPTLQKPASTRRRDRRPVSRTLSMRRR